ncbi:MAG: M4 family metallopeptidase [Armatimonadetes bacterium]|nr:M4 family metallopeptidase [Armatimonadota bacterium]
MANSADPAIRVCAQRTAGLTAALRSLPSIEPEPTTFEADSGLCRQIFCICGDGGELPGDLRRSEGDPPTGDPLIDEAYGGVGATYRFFKEKFDRDSIDNKGMPIAVTICEGPGFSNSLWNGNQLICGDGDGKTFHHFTSGVDVIALGLAHRVVSIDCELEPSGQSGALHEHFADVLGSMARQYARKQRFSQADWLIGRDIVTRAETRLAIRSLMAPGTAFINDPFLGTDPQRCRMQDLYSGPNEVHVNSGIPNHAFYLAAKEIGGYSWDTIGNVWYQAMQRLDRTAQFSDLAGLTRDIARVGYSAKVYQSIDLGWKRVDL